MIYCMDLVPGKEYYIQTYKGEYIKGMKFHHFEEHNTSRSFYDYVNMIFERTTFYLFDEEDYYYDPEKIRENAQKAREQMEQRALNMILKRVVDEHFEW